jgi:hypothetical protein
MKSGLPISQGDFAMKLNLLFALLTAIQQQTDAESFTRAKQHLDAFLAGLRSSTASGN